MPDKWEIEFGLNPNNSNDASGDPDSDGVTNINEYNNATNPNSSDGSDNTSLAKRIAETMRAFQGRYYYITGLYIDWPNNTNGTTSPSPGPDYPEDDYYLAYLNGDSNPPDRAKGLINYIHTCFWDYYTSVKEDFIRDDYWHLTNFKDAKGSSDWTYGYSKSNYDPEFKNLATPTSGNYIVVLREYHRILTRLFTVMFPKNSPYYTASGRKYGLFFTMYGEENCDPPSAM